eukprot:Mrub_04634.p4 GENE.Mrub_04634~~Mrub_04634.p4  ORF type:complete len:130 (+),score=0.65 Mrub_04634:446-835(+)
MSRKYYAEKYMLINKLTHAYWKDTVPVHMRTHLPPSYSYTHYPYSYLIPNRNRKIKIYVPANETIYIYNEILISMYQNLLCYYHGNEHMNQNGPHKTMEIAQTKILPEALSFSRHSQYAINDNAIMRTD